LEIMSLNPPNSALPFESSADKLTIETPEQTALDFAVAGIGSRFLAIAYDALIQLGIGLAVGLGGSLAMIGIAAVAPKAAVWGGALLILFFFLLYFGYYAFFEILWNGQTPGKRKVGIRVIKDSGRPLTPAESIGRNLLRIVDWLPGMYAVGIASAFLTKGNKRLGDLLVGSLVVRETSLKELKPVWQMAPAGSAAPATLTIVPLGAANLTPEEGALVESFLTRRSALDYDVRVRIANDVFRKIKDKLTIPADNTLSVERLLEAVSYERRVTGTFS
jgi:uncharacterized RDD family membrane protein YckC